MTAAGAAVTRSELLKALNTLIVQLPAAEQTKAAAHNAAVTAETQIAGARAVVSDQQDYARLGAAEEGGEDDRGQGRGDRQE